MATGRVGGLRRLRLLAHRPEKSQDAESELIEALTSSSSTWRLAAIRGLVQLGSEATLPGAERLLELGGQTDPFLRLTLLGVLARAGNADVDDLAHRALGQRGKIHEGLWPARPQVARSTGEAWPLRLLAARALGASTSNERARGALLDVLEGDPDWAVRAEAALALAPCEGDEVRAALELGLQDRRLPVRQAAARSLGREPPSDEDRNDAWRVPGFEPYFRYLGGSARGEYSEELKAETRSGVGRNWGTFGILCDIDMGDRPPKDVNPRWRIVREMTAPSALTCARDLVHHPSVVWGEDPSWPVCCDDFAVFYGHNLSAISPPSLETEAWFLESLITEMPLPDCSLEELEADTYAFRCGYCGGWLTTYVPDL